MLLPLGPHSWHLVNIGRVLQCHLMSLALHEDSVLERSNMQETRRAGQEGLRLYESVLTQVVHLEQVTLSGFSFLSVKRGGPMPMPVGCCKDSG